MTQAIYQHTIEARDAQPDLSQSLVTLLLIFGRVHATATKADRKNLGAMLGAMRDEARDELARCVENFNVVSIRDADRAPRQLSEDKLRGAACAKAVIEAFENEHIRKRM